MTKPKAAKEPKTKRTKLYLVTCPVCLNKFKVADMNNWVCTNCYERHVPDWIAAKKKSKPKVDKERA